MSVLDSVKGALPEISLPDIPRPEISLPEISLADATKPLYAIVGAGDLAVESAIGEAKTLQDQLTKLPAQIQEQLPALPKTAQAKATEYYGDVTGYVSGLPAQLTTLRAKATPETAKALPDKAKALNAKLTSKATTLYGELAGRGEKFVGDVLEKPTTKKAEKAVQDAILSAATASKKAESALRGVAGKVGIGSTPATPDA
jgi:hypothetical protein